MTVPILLLASFLVAVAPVVSILAIRNCVHGKRNVIIDRLDTIFKDARLVSWEFVKSKYHEPKQSVPAWIGDIIEWTAAAVPLIVVNWAFVTFAIATVAQSRFGVADTVGGFVLASPQPVRWVILTGFCAAFLNMCANLLRAVKNFDFNPLTFLDTTVDIVLGVFVGLVFYFTYDMVKNDLLPSNIATVAEGPKVPVTILFAFAASYYPDVVKRYLVRVSNFNYIKIEKKGTFTGLELMPVEVIDGVDSTIRKRLEDYHVYCVENLAVANPIMLFVETPYGLYALVDWVAQAQMFAAFGVQKAGGLLELGVRTLFDLEPYAQDPSQHAPMLKAVGDILLKGVTPPNLNDANAIVAEMLKAALSSPHVRRLGQLIGALDQRLDVGDARTRLQRVADTQQAAR